MKKLLSLSLALFAAAAVSQAQQFQVLPLTQTNAALGNLDGLNTNAVQGVTSATNYYITIPGTPKYGDVALSFSFKQATGSATDVCKAVFDTSADNVYWVPATTVLSVAANGTTVVGTNLNVTLNSIGYMRLAYVTNAANTIMTNLNVTAVFKSSRFGN